MGGAQSSRQWEALGGGQGRSEAGQPDSSRSGFLSQKGTIPGGSSHGNRRSTSLGKLGWDKGGAWAGLPVGGGWPSQRPGDLHGCAPRGQARLGFASSLALAHPSTGPGFLSRWLHPTQGRGRAHGGLLRSHTVFSGGRSGQVTLVCLVTFGLWP